MSDKKISQLAASSTPLAGTEVLPIVQSGATTKVSVSDLTAGRDVLMENLGVGTAINPSYKIASSGPIISSAGANYFAGTLGIGATPAYKLDVLIGGGVQSIFRAGQSGVSNGFIITSDGTNLTYAFNTGNIVIGTAGKGIDFSADPSAAGMTSELLDDYEEGTWTPVVVGTTAAGTCTYVTQVGSYTKVGRLVYFQMEVNYTTHTGTGNMQITGLPYVVATSGTAIANPSGLTFSNDLVIIASAGGSALVPFTYATGAARAFLPMDAAAIITVSGCYSV